VRVLKLDIKFYLCGSISLIDVFALFESRPVPCFAAI